MGRQTCMLLAVILAFFSCHRQVSPVPADPSAILLPVAGSETASAATKKAVKALPEIRKKEVATYQRTPCYGKCPVFRVVWYSDGSVMYIGSAYVDKRGYYRAAPGRTAIGALLESVAELGFFDLADQYPPNGPFPTEFPNIIISLQQGDFEKKVVHNHLAPPNLLQIETLLEEWLDRQSWEAFTP